MSLINYNELMPVLVIGFVCSIIACIDLWKKHMQEDNKSVPAEGGEQVENPEISIHDFIKSFLVTTMSAIGVFYACGLITENYLIKLGLTVISGIAGFDKVITTLLDKIKSR